MAAFALLTQVACRENCHPAAASVEIDGGCVDAWACEGSLVNGGQYEVRCTPDEDGGWAACQCFRNGLPERMIGNDGIWCHRNTSFDAYERIIDANAACGWKMSTSNI